MKIFNDFYSDEAVKFLLNEIKERNNNTSYILL